MNRRKEIKKLRELGWKWEAIGYYFRISKTRACQIGKEKKNSKEYKKYTN